MNIVYVLVKIRLLLYHVEERICSTSSLFSIVIICCRMFNLAASLAVYCDSYQYCLYVVVIEWHCNVMMIIASYLCCMSLLLLLLLL